MKVLHVIDSAGLYGAEKVLLSLQEQLTGMGVASGIASIGEPACPDKPLEIEARRRGLDVRRVTMTAGPDRRAARSLVVTAREEGYDVLHTHGYKANTLIAGQRRRARRLPTVATLHGWTATRRCSRMGVYQIVERIALRRADQVVAVSEAMVSDWDLRARYGNRLAVIHNGVTMTGSAAEVSELPAGISAFIGQRRSVFAAGRLSREKGFDVLIEAIASLRADGTDVCLVLAGDGDQRTDLEGKTRSLGIEASVIMPGYLEDARCLMGHFDVLAIPSRSEGLPIVLLEALISGMRVAATAVGDMPAVLSSCDAGGCALPGDAASLARRLQELLSEPHDAERTGQITDLAARQYSAGSMASAYKTVYEELLSPR